MAQWAPKDFADEIEEIPIMEQSEVTGFGAFAATSHWWFFPRFSGELLALPDGLPGTNCCTFAMWLLKIDVDICFFKGTACGCWELFVRRCQRKQFIL